jgi:MFS family permease
MRVNAYLDMYILGLFLVGGGAIGIAAYFYNREYFEYIRKKKNLTKRQQAQHLTYTIWALLALLGTVFAVWFIDILILIYFYNLELRLIWLGIRAFYIGMLALIIVIGSAFAEKSLQKRVGPQFVIR